MGYSTLFYQVGGIGDAAGSERHARVHPVADGWIMVGQKVCNPCWHVLDLSSLGDALSKHRDACLRWRTRCLMVEILRLYLPSGKQDLREYGYWPDSCQLEGLQRVCARVLCLNATAGGLFERLVNNDEGATSPCQQRRSCIFQSLGCRKGRLLRATSRTSPSEVGS